MIVTFGNSDNHVKANWLLAACYIVLLLFSEPWAQYRRKDNDQAFIMEMQEVDAGILHDGSDVWEMRMPTTGKRD